jgi:rhodanese-related sulfurtransferase
LKLRTLKEILVITLFSSVLALVFNHYSDNGITLLRKEIVLKWESDAVIAGVLADSSHNIPSVKLTELQANSKEDVKNDPQEQKIEKKEIISEDKKSPNIIDTPKTFVKIDSVKPALPVTQKPVEPVAITIEQAEKLYNSTNALFIDARYEAEYNLGHIKGSINIPLKRYDAHKFKLDNIPKNRLIITYCDGRGCDLSIDLAQKINELGYTNIKIFYGGWMDWKEKNYPIEK